MTTLADLKALADAATPGPWHSVLPGDVAWAYRRKYRCVAFGKRDSAYTTSALQPPDARYIAACSPEVIKALVAVAEAAESVRVWGEATGRVDGPEPKPGDLTYYADIRQLRPALDALKAVLA